MVDRSNRIESTMDRRNFCAATTAAIGTAWMGMSSAASASQASGPVVNTRYGRVRGFNDGPVKVFKNIPYGASTAGANRWMPPQSPQKWSGIRETIAPGFMSPQSSGGAPLAEETAMLQRGPIGEDCLNLNVYTPVARRDSKRRPVMVWFHGGGFAAGSGNADSTDGRGLAERHDTVFVTVTHRLNVFGFLYLADLFGPQFADSGNAGILDCVAALRWVHENIANFGGDPGNVTIIGQSGGGMKVSTLMAMPAAVGLFHRAIIQSGGMARATPKEQASANARRFVDALGVKTAAEMQALPWQDVVAAMEKSRVQGGPVMEGATLPTHPFDPVASPLSRDIPLMIGATETEATFFPNTPLDPIDDARLLELVKTSMRASDADATHLMEVFRQANPGKENVYLYQLLSSQTGLQGGTDTVAERKAAQGGAPVYVYYFTKHTSVRDGKLRAPHTLEIPYALDNLARSAPIVGAVTAANQALADKTSAAWVSFARTGNPNNPKIPEWPRFDTGRRATMIIDDQFRAADDPLRVTRLAIAEVRSRAPAGPPGGPQRGGPPPG